MEKCYNDVREFMQISQPDMVSKELRAPELREEDERGVPSTQMARDLAAQMVEVSKDIRILPLHGKPHPTRLGLGLMLEELGETIQAAEQGDLVEFADGLADLVYVTVWTALAHGIDLPAVWSEVQRSNMAKYPECESCLGAGRVVVGLAHDAAAEVAASIFPGYVMQKEPPQKIYRRVATQVRWMVLAGKTPAEAREQIPELAGVNLQDIERMFLNFRAAYDSRIQTCSACAGAGRVVVRDASGKVQKPQGWTPPDIKGVLEGTK